MIFFIALKGPVLLGFVAADSHNERVMPPIPLTVQPAVDAAELAEVPAPSSPSKTSVESQEKSTMAKAIDARLHRFLCALEDRVPIEDKASFMSWAGIACLIAGAKNMKTSEALEILSDQLDSQKTVVGQMLLCLNNAVKDMFFVRSPPQPRTPTNNICCSSQLLGGAQITEIINEVPRIGDQSKEPHVGFPCVGSAGRLRIA